MKTRAALATCLAWIAALIWAYAIKLDPGTDHIRDALRMNAEKIGATKLKANTSNNGACGCGVKDSP